MNLNELCLVLYHWTMEIQGYSMARLCTNTRRRHLFIIFLFIFDHLFLYCRHNPRLVSSASPISLQLLILL